MNLNSICENRTCVLWRRAPACAVHRDKAIAVSVVRVRAVLEQQLDHLRLALESEQKTPIVQSKVELNWPEFATIRRNSAHFESKSSDLATNMTN